PQVGARLAKATEVEVTDKTSLNRALSRLFVHFKKHGAKACAISLPPNFAPLPVPDGELGTALLQLHHGNAGNFPFLAHGVFWALAEHCREFKLPFDLMIGVNRRVYRNGVFQGQDLFDQRTSLIQYAELFNAFP